MKRKNGFTLIELLIVMAIIAILIGICVASFSGFRAEANKTKALQELKVIQLALEAYYKNNNHYPEPIPAAGDWEDILVTEVPQIIPAKVYDPFNSGQLYCYALSSGDISVSKNNRTYFGSLFSSPAWAAAAGEGSFPPPPPASTYLTAKYYIIWSIGLDGDVSQICSVSQNGIVQTSGNAIWVSNGYK